MKFIIRGLEPGDWPSVREIYHQGILTGLATFETEIPTWEEWDQSHRKDCRLAAAQAREQDEIIGWAALSPVSGRCVYEGVGEVSVYVAAAHRGQGVGKSLLKALVGESEAAGLWTLQAGIFPENKASIVAHEQNGFRKVGIRRRLGRLNGAWRDVCLLERRSENVG